MAAIESLDATSLAASLLDPIPANRLLGVRVLTARDGHAEVAMEVVPETSNVIGSLHSSGLVALADAAGLAAVLSMAGGGDELERVVPLGSAARMEFVAPARGRLVATCRLDGSDRHAVRMLLRERTDRASADTEAIVRGQDGTVVCRGTFSWKIRRLASP